MSGKRIVILGAGISGLSLAWFLEQRFGSEISLTLIDRAEEVGGWIQTKVIEGCLCELGPRNCRGIETRQLAEAVGLGPQIIEASPIAKKRFLWMDQQLQELPSGLLTALFSPLMRGWMGALWNDWSHPKTAVEDESVEAFFERRLSPAFTARFIDPLVTGIYAGDHSHLSMASCFPKIWEMEQKHGSLVRGMIKNRAREREALFSFKEGMHTLPKAIESQLNAKILLSQEVKRLTSSEEGITVHLSDQSIDADHVYSTLSPHALTLLLNPVCQRDLNDRKAASVAVVNLGFRQRVLPKEGFGYLVPSQENEDILGVVWDSSVFPQHNGDAYPTRLTVMLGGSRRPDIPQLDFLAIEELAVNAATRHLELTSPPDITHLSVAKDAIPQYPVGHPTWVKQLVQQIEVDYPDLTLLGCGFYGVGVNDCIAKAKEISGLSSLQKKRRLPTVSKR